MFTALNHTIPLVWFDITNRASDNWTSTNARVYTVNALNFWPRPVMARSGG